MADAQEQNKAAKGVVSLHREASNTNDPFEFDQCLAQIDLAKLASIAGNVPSSQPPFYNCFMNQFVNSPNFQKRLA
jgi:hypothetical protein